MAENKKSVLLYCDIIHVVEALNDDEAGRLFKHYLRYINDLNPCAEDRITALVFEPMKQNLKRDLKKWECRSEKNSVIAKEGWKKRKDANACERITPHAKHADKDKVIVKVTDKDKVIVKDIIKKESKIFVLQNVSLLQSEIETLQSQYSEQELNWIYDKLSNYKLSTDKKYKSDYGAINTWVIDSMRKAKNDFVKDNNTGQVRTQLIKNISDSTDWEQFAKS